MPLLPHRNAETEFLSVWGAVTQCVVTRCHPGWTSTIIASGSMQLLVHAACRGYFSVGRMYWKSNVERV